MANAWLDSLSEDWVSQPRSDISQAQLPSFSDSEANSRRSSMREQISRIPRLSQAARLPQSRTYDNSANVLSERSSNDINIQGSQRVPSKLSQELKSSQRGRHLSRSVSASTAGSVLHNTIQHKSLSASPTKGRESVPEWKRRLLLGDLAYGEVKDLFSSAGTGLEYLFRPPPPSGISDTPQADQGNSDENMMHETTLPSSPPPYLRSQRNEPVVEESFNESSNDFSEIRPAPRVREMKYTRNDEFYEDMSRPDGSTVERSEYVQDTATQDYNETSSASMTVQQRFDASRKTSGKSVIHNEDFSPILITRHNNEDGRVSFAPVELPADQLKKRLDKLRRNQMLLDSEPDSEAEQGSEAPGDSIQNPDTTDDFGRHGGFLNLKRGGCSAEGSFRTRPLSPPLNTDTSEMLPESSLQASTPKQFPTIRTDRFVSADRRGRPSTPSSPEMPRPPNPSPEKRLYPTQSPLKLFGPYDTFTNQTLLRRISQFEDPMTESPSRSMDHSAQVPPQGSQSKSEMNRGFVEVSRPQKVQQVSHGHHEIFGAVNKFGAGELDGYVFNEDISLNSSDRSVLTDKENMAPEEESLPRGQPFKFSVSHHSSLSGEDSLMIRRRRNRSSTAASSSKYTVDGTAPRPQSSSGVGVSGRSMLATPQRDGSEGKRPRTSPSKDPTPKRRRTLHRSDIAYGEEERPAVIESVLSSHYQMQTGIGRKRKDARQGEMQQAANPTIMAIRQILRPRTPTPSQRSSVQREREPLADLHFSTDDMEALATLEGSEIFVQDFAIDGSRKTSIKTQDFFDEAERIMAMIRNKARPQTGLTSVEESEIEGAEQRKSVTPDEQDDSFQDSFKEPFSRPPSREGRPILRMPNRQEDPALADKLRQYEEVSEMGDLITYSMRSMGLAKEAIQEVNQTIERVQESIRFSEMRHSPSADDIISDLPNVRLTRNPDAPANDEQGFPSHGSHSSSTSTGRSIPTGSSRGSDSRRLIAPDLVSQLIGDQVGNMVLDKENNVWTKVKTPKPPARGQNFLPSEDSEDDPFASIPDLSVDINRETQHLGLKTAPLEDLQEYVKEDFPHPPSSGKKSFATERSIDVKSILSHTKETFTKIKQTLAETAFENEEDIEHEITIHEDRVQNSSPSRRRNLTITFSSPIASIIQDAMPQHSDGNTTEEEGSSMDKSVGDIAADSLKRGRNVRIERSFSSHSNKSRSRSRSKGAARNLSMREHGFVPRPVSRIDEQDEDTAVDDSVAEERQVSIRAESSIVIPDEDDGHVNRRTSVSFVITPAHARSLPRPVATPVIAQHVGTLSLSPLSEFTMTHGDQSNGLEVSYVVGDNYLVTGDRSKRIMSQAIRSLVEKITEVEPFEPDWDAMQELDINNKQLKSLHKLDEFCAGVVTLDASNNFINHLDGVPEGVRNLKITHNHLSELTAWGHLTNLQYVDISNNQINSLYAFKGLVHLRNLRADNNQITSLDGIKFHDSLQVLRVRGNLIEDVDLDGTKLHRLTELDLQGNQISSIDNIEQLPCLSVLNLENNRLSSFATTTGQIMSSLKYLKLSNNALTVLSLATFPAIRMLHADRNQLTTVTNSSRARRLDSLSLREQKGDTPLDLSFLSSAYEVRKLFLSGNLLAAFEPKVDFLNLQFLELANCGLQCLPENFGQLMPNLRTLNLNFNALEDLSALRYIPRLKKLLVAGNRLADSGVIANLLSEFPHLSKLDLRDNPATLGFYPPVQTLVSMEREMEFDSFVLADASGERDERFTTRLDMGTKQRRRFYEIVVSQRCGRLKVLDGLAVDRQEIRRKDGVWMALLGCGVVSEVAPEKEAAVDKICANEDVA
ncbi:WD repeat domain-containing protein [Xylariales sp. AK1849]|nr:WD repeat domain-containing protein [Xylariales sp. AK1849]